MVFNSLEEYFSPQSSLRTSTGGEVIQMQSRTGLLRYARNDELTLDPRFRGDDDSRELPICGIDILLQDESLLTSLAKKKVALITNQNSLTQNYRLSAHALAEQLGDGLKCILTPEHG